jgi:aspartyl-tRNA(Asn)/glutamyl-tRNA(Gln) amidotransferase subunit A
VNVSEISKQVRSKERRALSVADDAIAAIEARDGDIHAFLHLDAEAIRAQARAVDAKVDAGLDPGRLAGVPVAIKDNLCQRGVPTTCASKILEGWKPPYDATVITRLAEAGAVLVGKTNLDEFAMGSSTENSAFGSTKNPVDLSRVPGGSSGGSAAAVAADYVPLSLGSDTGGSIRQPAAFCGVVGLKPTYGAVSRYGLIAFASSLDQVGPFARSVNDAGVLFEVIAGHDPMDSTSLEAPAPDVMSGINAGVAGLRIGIIPEMIEGSSDEVRARVTTAHDALRAAGATLVELPAPELTLGLAAYYLIAPAEASSNLARYDGVRYGNRVDAGDVSAMMTATRTAGFGDEVKRRIMLGTYALSAGYYDAYYGQAQKVRTLIIETFNRLYGQCDLIVGATTPTTAFEFGSKTADPMSMYYSDIFTIPSNLAGHPAMSVPFGSGDAGLPIGVQLLGPALSEPTLFRAAKFLESEVSQ